MAIETVEDAQHELNAMIEEAIADQYDDPAEADEGSIAADLFVSMCYGDIDPAVLAEVARREFGFVPGGAPQAVADAWKAQGGDIEW
jgi:hypothetical protein